MSESPALFQISCCFKINISLVKPLVWGGGGKEKKKTPESLTSSLARWVVLIIRRSHSSKRLIVAVHSGGKTGKDKNADTIERFQLTSNTIDGWAKPLMICREKYNSSRQGLESDSSRGERCSQGCRNTETTQRTGTHRNIPNGAWCKCQR